MYITAIVLAAGKGLRLKTKLSKPLIKVNSRPLIIYCLDTLSKHPAIGDIIVVANRRNLKDISRQIRRYRIGKIKDIVLGGRLRRVSVANGLRAIDKECSLVMVHDSARPFIDKKTISSLIKTAARYGAAIVGVPVKATIKSVKCQVSGVRCGFLVKKTLDRDNLWEVQTPQVFKKGLILKAYKKFGNTDVTDDASLVEKLGRQVRVVEGSYFNIKITTPEDLVLAEAILKSHKL
ncbi:MAG: 2-C-methyl-D-erythritol 4-phosphate cytidylyltransferase [Candidatus Omnitrophica bacterium]|nr:2-C-methyl-D-erythritol 4-phosphate cytidylyltransferase [Candidatus Omnitrophota bacterium]MDD5593001.1 2-C-methyl-D-erythritol 4-phosphate cytidylyltransferase [Candidatus Omnitrophota bacterium]